MILSLLTASNIGFFYRYFKLVLVFCVITYLFCFYSGLVLQDLTFVHVGNPGTTQEGNINFAKCWQQFQILDNMRRFKNRWENIFFTFLCVLDPFNFPKHLLWLAESVITYTKFVFCVNKLAELYKLRLA